MWHQRVVDCIPHTQLPALYSKSGAPVISNVASVPLQSLIESGKWASNPLALATATIEQQINIYHESIADADERGKLADSLVESTALKIAESLAGNNPEDDIVAINSIPQALARRAIWNWPKLPYVALCAGRNSVSENERPQASGLPSDARTSDIDEWVILNERWLRDDIRPDWTKGLVKWSAHTNTVFPGSKLSEKSRIIYRAPVSGYKILDDTHLEEIQVQPSTAAFSATFSSITRDILKGLDWSNVFVAGGIVLGSLLSVDENSTVSYKDSDIDIYLYGLSPVEANKKILHIFDVWKSNLPASAETLVVRNSRTITFFSTYPNKRVQIVLKLVKHPREVLLNFDLDICSMGWDGTELWLLPRAARALQTGYNVFTMNLIEGHYLGERRASQEQRVFKYADKGYGIRFLPSYVDALVRLKPHVSNFVMETESKDSSLDLAQVSQIAEAWTLRVIRRYVSWNHDDTTNYLTGNHAAKKTLESGPARLPIFSHALLDERDQKTTEPAARSCLSGFELLMRHAALWKEKVKGNIRLDEASWASTSYDEHYSLTGYDDTPQYQWNEDFNLRDFEYSLVHFNYKEARQFEMNTDSLHIRSGELREELKINSQNSMAGPRRVSFAPTASEIMLPERCMAIPLFLPAGLAKYANDAVRKALGDHDLPATTDYITSALVPGTDTSAFAMQGLEAVLWDIDVVSAWQQIDRRIDEVFEVLWSFHRTYQQLVGPEEDDHLRLLITQLSRRAIRRAPADEYISFARWVARKPYSIAYSYGGMGQNFWGGEEEWDQEYDERNSDSGNLSASVDDDEDA